MEKKETSLFVIPNLSELIEPNMKYESSSLLSTNYSRLRNSENDNKSRLYKVDLKLLNPNTGEDWMLSLAAKTLPKNIANKELARTQRRFKNEVGIYMSAKPLIENYLHEKGIKNCADYFATPFGGRINLNGNNVMDDNAILILLNYSSIGFQSVPRQIGLDLECSKLLLKSLAKFHGTFYGLKYHETKEFNEKVKPYLADYYMPEYAERIARKHLIQVLRDKEFSMEVIERAMATFDRRSIKETREPYAIFTHNNVSVDNILVRLNRNGNPEHIKLLDFAKSEYNSPLRDLLFFLFSSVELKTLKKHFDDLVDCYYYSWVSILKRVGIDEPQVLFCRLTFNKELKIAANQSEFYKILCMLYTILETTPSNVDRDNIGDDIPELEDSIHMDRICYIVEEFDSKGWLSVEPEIMSSHV